MAVYLPNWVSVAQGIEQVDLGAFIIVDESSLQFMALRYQSDANAVMRKLLMVARHRKQSLVFIAQVAADVDKSILRQMDCLVFKQPTLMQAKNDRPEVRATAGQALQVFESMSADERLRSAFVYDEGFTDTIQYNLPDYWREELSVAFANVPLSANDASQPNEQATAQAALNNAELRRRVLEMRKSGLSLRVIADLLGVGVKKVREALPPGELGGAA